jgi:hypothetical protein
MPKTYNSLTVANATAGSAILASDQAKVFENVNNYRVPPSCIVYRSSDLTSYSQGTAITWNAEAIDTDGMWSSGTDVTIQTAGLYLLTLKGQVQGTATITAMGWRIAIGGTSAVQSYTTSVNSGTITQNSVSIVASLAATNTVSANVSIGGGSAYIVKGGASVNSEAVTSLSVVWLGQVS